MSWNCLQCNAVTDDRWAYCPLCGSKLLETCSECGKQEQIGRPMCLTRLYNIRLAVGKYAEEYADTNGKKRRGWVMNNIAHFRSRLGDELLATCLFLIAGMPLLIFIFASSLIPRQFLIVCVMSIIGIGFFLGGIAFFLTIHVDKANGKSLKKEGMLEYYKKHPDEYAMLRLVESSGCSPISHLLERMLP